MPIESKMKLTAKQLLPKLLSVRANKWTLKTHSIVHVHANVFVCVYQGENYYIYDFTLRYDWMLLGWCASITRTPLSHSSDFPFGRFASMCECLYTGIFFNCCHYNWLQLGYYKLVHNAVSSNIKHLILLWFNNCWCWCWYRYRIDDINTRTAIQENRKKAHIVYPDILYKVICVHLFMISAFISFLFDKNKSNS